jgi:hypothetical protein
VYYLRQDVHQEVQTAVIKNTTKTSGTQCGMKKRDKKLRAVLQDAEMVQRLRSGVVIKKEKTEIATPFGLAMTTCVSKHLMGLN